MSNQGKKKGKKAIGNEILDFIIENRQDVPTSSKGCSFDTPLEIINDVLTGGHSKVKSALRNAGLTKQEIETALG